MAVEGIKQIAFSCETFWGEKIWKDKAGNEWVGIEMHRKVRYSPLKKDIH
jgi:hypothetical protein